MPGSIAQLGPWDPAKQPMTKVGDGIYEATVSILDGTDFQYKYTRGSWETVEEWGSITGTNNRSATVDGGITHTMLIDDTATNWGDATVPDIHKAVQYWRDPLVVSNRGHPGGAHRDVPARRAADRRRLFRLDRRHRPVRPGRRHGGRDRPGHPWSGPPAAPLPAGAYTATVAQVSSTGDAGVPIREPYTTTFLAVG